MYTYHIYVALHYFVVGRNKCFIFIHDYICSDYIYILYLRIYMVYLFKSQHYTPLQQDKINHFSFMVNNGSFCHGAVLYNAVL